MAAQSTFRVREEHGHLKYGQTHTQVLLLLLLLLLLHMSNRAKERYTRLDPKCSNAKRRSCLLTDCCKHMIVRVWNLQLLQLQVPTILRLLQERPSRSFLWVVLDDGEAIALLFYF